MKKDIHPSYQDILFVDTATGHKFVCGSTLQPKDTEKFEGKDYPTYRVSISSSSHPFFTGSQQLVDSEGRVDKFKKRYSKKPAAPKVEAVSPIEKIKEKKKEKPAVKAKPASEKKPDTAKKTAVKKVSAKSAPKKPKE
ncbi:MAG: type B 50S ribosomal protein L31 [Simkaniaceae bacterium]|nr:type B 50S ribosomal protein L31 [Simkaniaceae bacterium]